MKKFLYCCLILLSAASCTSITAVNQPGKPENEFPEFMRGEFDLIFPETMSDMMEGVDSTMGAMKIRITSNTFVTITDKGSNINLINDSTSVCKVKNDVYLCMGREPEFIIFKVEDKKSEINLYPMFIMGETTVSDLKKYFKEVKQDPEDVNNYIVTINPKKLKKYFDGPLPYKDPFVLKRTK